MDNSHKDHNHASAQEAIEGAGLSRSFAVTKSASRAWHTICHSRKDRRRTQKATHRAHRRAVKGALRGGNGGSLTRACHTGRLTGRDIS